MFLCIRNVLCFVLFYYLLKKAAFGCHVQLRRAILNLKQTFTDDNEMNSNNKDYIKLNKKKSKTNEFYFLSERLGKDKLLKQQIHGHIMSFYSDSGACYYPGLASSYRGNKDAGHSGKRCEKWSVVVSLLEKQINTFQKHKIKLMEKYKLPLNFKSNIDDYIEITNKTIYEMINKNILHHNYCRDPDETGIPWCYVKLGKEVAWEPCNIPKCTICWGLRQRVLQSNNEKFWKPFCAMLEGDFLPLQCHLEYCWCSEKNGTLIKGSVVNAKKNGMPVCDPILRNQLLKSELGKTTDGQDTAQAFVEALVMVQLKSYQKLMDISSNMINDLDFLSRKKTKTMEK